MSRAETVEVFAAGLKAGSVLDIVFVHGLMGSARNTWACDEQLSSFWPAWLSDLGDVWIVDYPADLFWWSNTGMALPERARSVVDVLANYRLGSKPILWITHSLGGLLVKLILRAANELNNPKWEPLARQTRGVAFRNAAYGSVAWKRRKSAQDANERERRKANEAHLLDLAAWYTRNAARLGIRTEAYYEKGTVRGLKVVDESSADPRVPDCMPVPSDANHMDICKPRNARDPVYMGVRNFVESFVPATVPLTGDRAPAPLDHNINTVFGMHRATRCTTCRGRGSTML